MPLWAAITQLYGFIYCMILSNLLTDMPIYGGVLYLCGRAVIVFVYTTGKDRRFLPAYARRWTVLLLIILLGIGLLLIGIFPFGINNEKIWILYAAVALCLCAEGNTDRLSRFLHPREQMSSRLKWVSILIEGLIVAAMSAILFVNFGWEQGWQMALGFLLLTVNRMYISTRLRGSLQETEWEETLEEADFRKAYAYHTVEKLSLLLVMAVELTVTSIYALLAVRREWLLPAMAVAILCTVIPGEIGSMMLRGSERKGRKDPTWLLCFGLILWLGGIILCIQMLLAGKIDYVRIYCCLAVCTMGGTLSLTGLGRIEELMPDAMSASGRTVPRGYWKLRITNWNLARLLGDTLALIALGIFCLVNRKGLPQTSEELAARFQPIMMIPVFLVVIGALISAFQFPLSRRYIEKIRKVLHLQESGVENPALQKQVDHVVTEYYRQPYMSSFLMFLCRMYFRCRLVNEDHIVTDDQNPLVFLCNHGEFYGPMVCKIYIPVPVRSWTVSHMMYDKKAVTEYIYENTTSRQKHMPHLEQRILARIVAWLSVNVMSQLEAIPVYRDSPQKLRETFRLTIDALEAGDNLLIFPENPEYKYVSEGIGELSPGFLILADLYWKRKGKRMRMLPVYADKKHRRITFGEIIQYNPENNTKDEQERILRETRDQIMTMAGLAGKGDAEA